VASPQNPRVMRDAIAERDERAADPPTGSRGLATLAIPTLTGAFFDYSPTPTRSLRQRLKLIRKLLAILVEYETSRTSARRAREGTASL